MAATGKAEIWLAIFAAASNAFMREYHDIDSDDKEEQSSNDDTSLPEGDTNRLKWRKQGNQRGKKKLIKITRVVMESRFGFPDA
jgi:hypothetical protein